MAVPTGGRETMKRLDDLTRVGQPTLVSEFGAPGALTHSQWKVSQEGSFLLRKVGMTRHIKWDTWILHGNFKRRHIVLKLHGPVSHLVFETQWQQACQPAPFTRTNGGNTVPF